MGKLLKVTTVFFALILLYGIWWLRPQPVMPEATQALTSTSDVVISENGAIYFQPLSPSTTGIIIYPGGLVPAKAYAPLARELAALRYPVWLVPMPLNLAVLGSNRAAEIMDAQPQITHWVMVGHSLGGAMAARFAYSSPERLAGLVLLAGYPAENQSLANTRLPVLSIFASEDGLATPEKIMASADRLPPDTRFTEIPGGNHAQFGWYGSQRGDGDPLVGRVEQQDQVISEIHAFLETM